MKTLFWRRWCKSLRSAKQTRPISRARPRRERLYLDALEDRVTPSLTPQMVLDINANTASSNPSGTVSIGSTAYFAADDGIHGVELWKTDGTQAGTALVRDIFPGSSWYSSHPSQLTNVNGTLFFTTDNGLWKSDGTEAGTVQVSSIGGGNLKNVNGTLFFSANDGNGTELWKSDGTTAGTVMVKDIYPGGYIGGYGGYYLNSSSPNQLTNVGGTLFFVATDGTSAGQLWKSDGTPDGTVKVKEIQPGGGYGGSGSLTNVNGTLFFSANDGMTGYELWKSDGTAAGTVLVNDMEVGSTGSYPDFATNVNGTLFFRATGAATGYELWKSDGTAAGTVLVKDIYPGADGALNMFSTTPPIGSTLYFGADDGVHGYELWKSDGTSAGTVLVKDINPGSYGTFFGYPAAVNGTLFFLADNWTGAKLWQSDGTAAGTVVVANLVPGLLTTGNGTLFFAADDGTHGMELWRLVDDAAPPLITIYDRSVTEGNTGTVALTFTVSLSSTTDAPVTVNYTTANGTATAGSDYQTTSGTLSIPAGQTTGTITVPVIGDYLGEPNETFFLNLSSPTNATINDGQGLGTIVDDEPRISISHAQGAEGNTGTVALTFTVSLSSTTDAPVTVNYTTANGTATAGSDYQTTSGTLSIPAGQTTGTITVPVIGDYLGEPNETFFLNLSSPTNATINDGQGLGTIVDDEPRISISHAQGAEGNTGTVALTFTVSLSSTTDAPVTVNYTTANGTATAGSDYQADSGTLTIPGGQTTGIIAVSINGDRLPEPNESFIVNLSSPTNAIIHHGQGVGTILDDEPRISISDVTSAEGKNRQTTLFVFTVTLSMAYDQPVTMSFATANGTATTSNNDYVARSGTLTFAPGETTKTISIEVRGDNRREGNETFYLELSGLSSNGLFTKSRGIGTILNDD